MPGEGSSVVIKAESTAKGLRQIAEAIQETGGQEVNVNSDLLCKLDWVIIIFFVYIIFFTETCQSLH